MTRRDFVRLGTPFLLAGGWGCASGQATVRQTAPRRLSYGSGPEQFGELRLPSGNGPHPVAVVVHGGFWINRYGHEHTTPLAASLTRAGWATWNIEYRRLGDPGGGWPGTFEDVGRAADHVRALAASHRLNENEVRVVGHSAGGHLALWLAARGRLKPGQALHTEKPLVFQRVIALAPVASLRRADELRLGGGAVAALMGGSAAQEPSRYAAACSTELLPLGVRQVLLHGSADRLVPARLSRDYATLARAQGDDVQYEELPGAGHFELVTPDTPECARAIDAVTSG